MAILKKYLEKTKVQEWGKVCHIDLAAGDTMHASLLGAVQDDA